jgi:DNA/RNA endonuclease YhcR with UshA esterase domain
MRLLAVCKGAALVSVLCLAGTINGDGASVLPDRDAVKHVGQSVTVEGTVTGTHVSTKGTEFLDFGSPYPNQDFTVVIFARSASALGDIATFYGKRVDITGTVELYRGRPEIVVREPTQIRVAH